MQDGRPYVKITRDGRLLASGYEPGYQESIDRGLSEGIPEIAPGKWLYLGNGDYKSVYRPEDGKADYVIKPLPFFKYAIGDEDPKLALEHIADAYREAYQIISQDIGDYLLSVRGVKVGPAFGASSLGIFKLQDYGILTSAWLLGEGKRELALEKSKIAGIAVSSAKERIRGKFASAGIDSLPLHFDMAWDYLRDRPVVYDILDSVAWHQPNAPNAY